MVRINLLPWREARQQRQNKAFMILIGMATSLSLLAASMIWSYFNHQWDEQKEANALIGQHNAELEVAVVEIAELAQRRKDLASKIQILQNLQGLRPISVHIWDETAKAIPLALYLNNFKREGDTLTLTGMADNPNVVSELIRNLNASQWMGESAVRSIQQDISAYQDPNERVVASPSGPANRPVLPEDSYLQFVVTTQVQHKIGKFDDQPTSATVNTAVSQ